jgi:hypothetical protein
MGSLRVATVLLVVALLAVAAPGWAVGPLDGSYQVSLTVPESEPLTWYVVVIQNGNNFGFALLDPEGFWVYGSGTLSPENRVTGPIIDPFYNEEYGQFELQFFPGGSVSGTIAIAGEAPVPLSGGKFF